MNFYFNYQVNIKNIFNFPIYLDKNYKWVETERLLDYVINNNIIITNTNFKIKKILSCSSDFEDCLKKI